MKKERMTGIVDGLENQIVFCSDGFVFTFMTCRFLEPQELISIHPEESVIYATTHDGKRIAIFSTGKDLKVQSDFTLTTDLYITSEHFKTKPDIKKYRKISFIGGALNQLHQTATFFDQESDDDTTIIKRKLERENYQIQTKKATFTLSIGYSKSGSANKSNLTFNNDVEITLSFEEDQPVTSFPMHHHYVSLLVSLLTGQTENHFDYIFLIPSEDTPHWQFNILEVHSSQNEEAELSDRPGIPLQMLHNSIPQLLGIFYNSKESKPSYSLEFIPRKEKERWLVSDDRVRAICAALECEANFDKSLAWPAQSMVLDELRKKTKEIIKENRKKFQNLPILSDRTYDLINGSINNWTIAAFDRFTYLYHKYEKSLKKMPIHWGYELTDDDIQALVKYRNNITHGSYRQLTGEIARIAIIMEAVVYCCLFHRIGLSDDDIDYICTRYLGRK